MKAMLGFTLTTFSLVVAASAVTPVQKVIQMLEEMTAKAKAAKHEENVQFAGFSEFCKNVKVSKAKDIEDAANQIELLNAEIEKANSEVERLGKEIKGHEAEITGWATDNADATKVRDEERGTYLVTHADYQESIEALEQAIVMLKKEDYDRSSKSFLQKVSTFHKTPEDDRQAIQSFLVQQGQDPDPDQNLGYKATAYKFQSSKIVDMLEKLLGEFKTEVTTLEKDEVARRQTHTMLLQDLVDQTKDGKNAIQEKTMTAAKNKQSSIEKSADLKEVSGVKASDEKYLSDLTSLCEQKTSEFESRTKLRNEEIEALGKAVEIISGTEVSDAKKHLPKLVQMKGSSFAQLRSAKMNPHQQRVVDFLREQGVRLDSHALSALAMEAASDPFGKVKMLIRELIERLMTQSTNEATHKGWCDKELATNKHTRETKSAEVETLTASIEGLQADIKSLTKDISKKGIQVSVIESSVAEMTKERTEEKTENAKTIGEASKGQEAITQAIKILEEFYAKAAKATALEQQPAQPKIPEIFDGAYQGQQSAKGGVVGMLEVIKSDFVRLEADTASAEQSAQNEYDEFMSDSAQTKAALEVDIRNAKTDKLAKEGELGDAQTGIKSAQQVLDLALASYDKLKEPCLGKGQTYADRKGRREDEIEALKQALELLSADNLPQ